MTELIQKKEQRGWYKTKKEREDAKCQEQIS
jgi:hypothetical protein